MRLFSWCALLSTVTLALATPTLHAATLTCSDSLGPYTTSSYSFEVAPSSTSSSASNPTLTALVPLDASYVQLFESAVTGKHIASCTLAEGASSLKLVEVYVADLKILSGNFYTLYTPSPMVQFVLNVAKVEIITGS